jgi:hypothetical protein
VPLVAKITNIEWLYRLHKYVPLAGFPNRRTCRVQRVEIITNMPTAILERLDQAILAVIDNPEKTQQTAAIGTLF